MYTYTQTHPWKRMLIQHDPWQHLVFKIQQYNLNSHLFPSTIEGKFRSHDYREVLHRMSVDSQNTPVTAHLLQQNSSSACPARGKRWSSPEVRCIIGGKMTTATMGHREEERVREPTVILSNKYPSYTGSLDLMLNHSAICSPVAPITL